MKMNRTSTPSEMPAVMPSADFDQDRSLLGERKELMCPTATTASKCYVRGELGVQSFLQHTKRGNEGQSKLSDVHAAPFGLNSKIAGKSIHHRRDRKLKLAGRTFTSSLALLPL
jgi:hypothetical protein